MMKIVSLMLGFFLAACTTTQSPTVTFRFVGDNITSSNLRAANYCHQFHRRAMLTGINSVNASKERMANYVCQ